ncbi:hypothetical protein [Citricoccus sp. NR2]|uniref:hypothetical protein n=1 Tax=Citricoccus sp. NR2 TaxID=3004095 RepID=UPI0022DDBB1A|nr:hypothetical protein [Citricoccus sp. NR2]WBL19696.1 hypothetical protein O1A05_03090 [Citricoccus sp. NR2]
MSDLIFDSDLEERLTRQGAQDTATEEIAHACLQVREAPVARGNISLMITGIITAVLLTLLTMRAAGRRAATTV